MSYAYTEGQLVKQPAIGLFAELGWAVAVPLPNVGVAGELHDAKLLGHETKGEVVLVSRLRSPFDENLTRYKQQVPALFSFNTLLRVWPMASIACRATGGGDG